MLTEYCERKFYNIRLEMQFVNSRGSILAREKLKGIDGRVPPEVEHAA